MNEAATMYIESSKERLKDHAKALVELLWSSVAIEQGADAERVLIQTWSRNLNGGK